MGLNSVENTLRALLIFFINKNNIGTCSDIAEYTKLDRTAIKKYLELYVDLMILIKYNIGKREYYTINRKYLELYTNNNWVFKKQSSNDKKGGQNDKRIKQKFI